ncbi:rhodanese-like domain-containing protein [Streptomyces sp. NPDC101225]|uniref:MBL fold metallo-hydrolase n=1 Tax=Streptomyces sp. NPDC101225 TaxID=3366135 RepID=UPI00380D67D5
MIQPFVWEVEMDLDVFVTAGLGDSSYLLVSGREALIVDPQRDAWRLHQAADQRGATVRAVLETHVHNDYVSGAHEIRSSTGAQILAPAKGRYEFPHRPVDEGDELLLSALRLVAMATPGHTYEHVSYLVFEGDAAEPAAVFTGGSLLVGSAGRPDLLGPAHTDELTRAQYDSLRRLAELPATARVLPTHGAGSFCVAAMPTTRRTSTIEEEQRDNALLTAPDFAEFSTELRGELMAYPRYYRHMAPINRHGAPVLGRVPDLPALTAPDLAQRLGGEVWVVDGRDRDAFAAAHIPGSVNIELNSGFASYVGWMLPFDAPLVLVLPEPHDTTRAEAVTQLIRIGWTRITGYLDGGIDAWTGGGYEVRSYPTVGVGELCDATLAGPPPYVLDVRQELERAWGTVPGSRQTFLADLPEQLADLPYDRPVWVICSNGHRAAIAASLLDRAGIEARLIGEGGVGEWRQRCAAALTAAR